MVGAADFSAQNCTCDETVPSKVFITFSKEKEIKIACWYR